LQSCHGVVAVSSETREIGDGDIARVIEAAQVIPIPPEREIIDVIPHQFIVDGLEEISDPRGMVGVRLEVEGTIITGSKTILHNLLRCVEKAGLEVADICLSPLALASVALSRDEKNIGVALIDIGGGSTTISVFDQGILMATSVLPIGGNHITKDLSIGLRTPMEEAEKLKLKHGHAFYNLASIEEKVKVPKIGGTTDEVRSQQDLAYIIEPRMAEILDLVREEIRRMGFYDLPGGYILTGGTTAMPGVLELAEHELDHNVRVAIPDYIGVREPQYTVSVGLIKFAYHNVKIQGKDVAQAVINNGPDVSNKRISAKRSAKQETHKPKAGVFSKMKNLYESFFD